LGEKKIWGEKFFRFPLFKKAIAFSRLAMFFNQLVENRSNSLIFQSNFYVLPI